MVTSGVQGIAPAIPAIQSEFSLTAGQVSLITSVYLLPAIFSAFLGGVLADRVGVRPVFAGALVVFGAGGLLLLLVHPLWLLLATRFLQGAAFGTVVALSVAIIGEVVPSGPPAARAQGRRNISMALGQAVFPPIAGLLLALSWFAPFAMQFLAIPLGLVAWTVLPPIRYRRKRSVRGTTREAVSVPGFGGVQVLGALRFFFMFAVATYYPVLAVNEGQLTPVTVGFLLGASALASAGAAALTEKLAHRWSPIQMIGGCVLVASVSVSALAVFSHPAIAVAGMVFFGLQDGVYAVAHNMLVTATAPADARSTYVGITGAVRNTGKFLAPLAFGAGTVVLTVGQGFLTLAGMGLGSLAVVHRLSAVLARAREADPDPDRAEAPSP